MSRLGLVIVCVAAALLCAPFIRSVAWFADEGVLLHAADRMLRGERLYVDFFEFLPPGGILITVGWLSIAGLSFTSARALAILSIIGIASFTYLACYRATRNVSASALPVIAWLVMSQGEPTQLNHHWLTTMFCSACLWALLSWVETPQRHSWLIAAGLTGGAAAMVTQSRGALALLAGLAAFNGLRQDLGPLVTYCLSALVVPAIIVAYLTASGLIGAAIESVVIWPTIHYHGIQAMPYGANPSSQNFPLMFVFPIAAIFAALYVVREWHAALNDRAFRLALGFGVTSFLGFQVRADALHITFAVPLVLPLLFRSAKGLNFQVFQKHRRSLVIIGALTMLTPCWILINQAGRALSAPPIHTPRGTIKLTNRVPGAEQALRSVLSLPEKDAVFFYPYGPLLSFLTARVHPARLDLFVPEYTTPDQFEDAETSALKSARWIVIDRATVAGWPSIFPGIRNPKPPELMRLEAAIERASVVTASFGDFELRQVTRNGSAPLTNPSQ